MSKDAKGKYQVPAVVGAIKVLRELSGVDDPGATQSDLVAATGLSKSTMHNLLSTLESNSFVRRDPDTRMYRLGPSLIPLGAAAARQVRLVRVATDRIAPLADEHNLSFALAQRVGEYEAQVIERFYPPHGVHVGITLGSVYGPLDGALGKILLAALPPARMRKLVKGRSIPAHTEATITSADQLIDEIEEARGKGWATSQGELNENFAASSGIRGQSGELELLLLALGFPGQLDASRIEEIGKLLFTVAHSVMTEVGIDPDIP